MNIENMYVNETVVSEQCKATYPPIRSFRDSCALVIVVCHRKVISEKISEEVHFF